MRNQSLILIFFIILLTSSQAGAGTVNWNISGDGLWSTSENWSPLIVPVPGDDVVINSGTGTITASSDTTIKTLTVKGTNKLVVATGKLTASAAVSLKVFVTSTTGKGNLNLWTGSGGATGLAAGDNICQARAIAAGLTGTYKAWLSDSTTDAYCHIQGYSAKKSANCGQVELPAAAGPWLRTDGHFFAGNLVDLINNSKIYSPARYDESGTLVSESYFAATNSLGEGLTDNCVNWTDNTSSNYGRYAYMSGTTGYWTDYGSAPCNATLRLLCFQTGTGGPLPALTPPTGSKKVFVTSTTYNGNLGGLTGADSICQTRAAAGSLANPTKFRAWLSTDAVNVIDRITSDGPWYRPDGVKVAANKAALTNTANTPLLTAISQTETGAYITYQYQKVWTSTGDNGAGFADDCTTWSSNSSGVNGRVGYANISDSGWTHVASYSCNNTYALYCFEDN